MIAEGENNSLQASSQPARAWMHIWHLWTIVIPRRSIRGRLAYGKVWRRHNGRHSIYK